MNSARVSLNISRLFFPPPAMLVSGAATMSTHLQCRVMGNCSSFQIKRNKHTYSTEPNNLKARNSFHYNRLIHCKTVGPWPRSWNRDPGENPPPPMCRPPLTRTPGPPSQHHARDLQEQVLPRSAHRCHSQSQHHPAQPEAYNGEEVEPPTKSSWGPALHLLSNKDVNHLKKKKKNSRLSQSDVEVWGSRIEAFFLILLNSYVVSYILSPQPKKPNIRIYPSNQWNFMKTFSWCLEFSALTKSEA